MAMAVSSLTQVCKGYVDDSRNTDNAWIETTIITLHCDKNTPLMADLNRTVSIKYHFISYSDFCTISQLGVSLWFSTKLKMLLK